MVSTTTPSSPIRSLLLFSLLSFLALSACFFRLLIPNCFHSDFSRFIFLISTGILILTFSTSTPIDLAMPATTFIAASTV